MLKKYLQSFSAMRFLPIMMIPSILIVVLAFFYVNNRNPKTEMAVAGMAIVLAVSMSIYYFEKFRIAKQVRNIKNPEEYDNAVILGQNFFLEKRLLVFYRGNVVEAEYTDIRKAVKSTDRKGNPVMELHVGSMIANCPCASKGQAQRFAAFLKKKNPKIELLNIVDEGQGTLESIYNPSGK